MVTDADGMLVHWEEVPTCGTPMEMVYAQMAGHQQGRKDTFVVTQSTIDTDDMSAFLTYHSDAMVSTFDEAAETLEYALWGDR
jgi:hypothetical protein